MQLRVGVYYESLCPDSIRFIENQLLPNYEHFADYIDLDFVPFGKAASFQHSDGVGFSCQHGPAECDGNKMQSCALTASLNQQSQMQFVGCQMERGAESSGQLVSFDHTHSPHIPYKYVQYVAVYRLQCAQQANIPYDAVANCVNSVEGERLQLVAEQKTQAIAHPNAMLNFVPTIVYNQQFDQEKQNRSLRNFRSTVCDELRATSANLPPICLI